jgi:hypothetical protein
VILPFLVLHSKHDIKLSEINLIFIKIVKNRNERWRRVSETWKKMKETRDELKIVVITCRMNYEEKDGKYSARLSHKSWCILLGFNKFSLGQFNGVVRKFCNFLKFFLKKKFLNLQKSFSSLFEWLKFH